MKRSQINRALLWAKELLQQNNIRLPRFAYWSAEEWRSRKDDIHTLRQVMQGWDITDFGSGDFEKTGAVLFTVRNGSLADRSVGSPYAEKYILLREGQYLPNHYHACKTEDIISRAGGVMSMYFYNMLKDGSVDTETPVTLSSDGLFFTVKPGEEVCITPGNSVRITPYVYHVFGAKAGCGPLIVGEVSSVNDDNTDNYWAVPQNRFARIEEDEAPLHPLCNEYDRL